MLINISNHPVSTWDNKQIKAATELWGDIIDIALPYIDPNLNGREVERIAEQGVSNYISEIQKYDEKNAFHVMGESVYCFHLIRLLKEAGYIVVASTTTRNVEYVGENKVTHFEFVQFRRY